MNDVTELLRLPSPAPRPQALAFDGATLWMGSIETDRLYAIDPQEWTARDEIELPGKPWGMTVTGDELRIVLGEPPDDDRFIHRYIPGHGFHDDGRIACPDNTGSQLAFDGDRLYLSQWYNKKILTLDEDGRVGSVIALARGICGIVVVGAHIYALTTDDEASLEYVLTRVDARGATPVIEEIARVPFAARALAYDGTRFWTNHRERNEIVAFTLPT